MTYGFLILFLLFALVAEILGTVGGFGSSVFFVPGASFFLPFQSVLAITALFHLSSNVVKLFFFRKGINLKVFLWIGVPAILAVIPGAYLTKYIPAEPLEICLGIFLIFLSVILLIARKREINPGIKTGILGGSVSGFAAGLVGSGGPVRGLTLSAFKMDKEVFVATSALIDLGVDLGRSTVYFSNGFVKADDLYLIGFILIASIAGTWLGKKILNRISDETFKLTVLILILLVGLVTATRAIIKYYA